MIIDRFRFRNLLAMGL